MQIHKKKQPPICISNFWRYFIGMSKANLITENLFNVNTQACAWEDSGIWEALTWGKSIVLCADDNLDLVGNNLQKWKALIRYIYPAQTGENKTECERVRYLCVRVKEPCAVWAWASGRCLAIWIPDGYVDYSFNSSNTDALIWENVAEVSRIDPNNPPSRSYVCLWERDGNIRNDVRCFYNQEVEQKKETCIYNKNDQNIVVWDAISVNPTWWATNQTQSNVNNARQLFAAVVVEDLWNQIRVQYKWCVDDFKWKDFFIEDGTCAYLSTIRWEIVPSTVWWWRFDPDFCFPVWVYMCGKLVIMPWASCLVNIIKWLKEEWWALDETCVELTCSTNWVIDTIWGTPMSHICMYEETNTYSAWQNIANQTVATFNAVCAWQYYVCFEWRRNPNIWWTLTWQAVTVNWVNTGAWWVAWVTTTRTRTCITSSNVAAWGNLTFWFVWLSQFNVWLQLRRIRIYKKVCAKSSNITKV